MSAASLLSVSYVFRGRGKCVCALDRNASVPCMNGSSQTHSSAAPQTKSSASSDATRPRPLGCRIHSLLARSPLPLHWLRSPQSCLPVCMQRPFKHMCMHCLSPGSGRCAPLVSSVPESSASCPAQEHIMLKNVRKRGERARLLRQYEPIIVTMVSGAPPA